MKRILLLAAPLALCLLCACATPAADCTICAAPTPEERIAAVENCAAYLSMTVGNAQITVFLDAEEAVLSVHGENDAGEALAPAAENSPLSDTLPCLLTTARNAGHLSADGKITMLACLSPATERDLLMTYHETVNGWLIAELPGATSEVLPSYLLSAR